MPIKRRKERTQFFITQLPRPLIFITGIVAVAYVIIFIVGLRPGHPVLFWLLAIGQFFYLWMLLTFLHTIWNTETTHPSAPITHDAPAVDVFITVAGEPLPVIEKTARAAIAMEYPHHQVYILNDGFVAKKDNWHDVEKLAQRLHIACITRTVPGGAKAGNINHALRQTSAPYIAIFDADHIPHHDFLQKTMGYFLADARVGFVQTPQYYANADYNFIAGAAWEQQQLFFGAICKGKNRLNVTTMCGTNMVINRTALTEVGGMCEESIAEDFATGLFMHQRGWKSVYVPEVLAEGLAPFDFLSYYKQQYRWARGGLDVIFKYNLLFTRGLKFSHRLQYLSSVSFYLSGLIVLMHSLIPLIYFFTGLVPVITDTMIIAAIFLPYIFLLLYVMQSASNFTYSFRALGFSISAFPIHLKALYSALTGKKAVFEITTKEEVQGNFLRMVTVHIAYILIAISGIMFALIREGMTAALVTNAAWALLNISIFSSFIIAALPKNARVVEYITS